MRCAATENLAPNAKGIVVPFPPHVMFYGPYLTNADLGSDGELGPDGNPDALIIVPVGVQTGPGHAKQE